MKPASSMAWLILLAASLSALAAPLPSDFSGPQRLDLSGVWDFKLDQQGVGEQQRWFAAKTDAGDPGAPWGKLAVPGSFNEQLANDAQFPQASDAMRFVKATGWYRTTFATPQGCVDTHQPEHCALHLSGTVLRHTVWLNGVLVGKGVRPYLDEAYDVTASLSRRGPNLLVIAVDNRIADHGIPDRNWHGWWDDGGLIRPVYLEMRPAAYGESHVVTTMAAAGGWQLGITTEVHAQAGAASVVYSLADLAGNVVWHRAMGPAAKEEMTSSVLLSNVKPWSPDRPVLDVLTTTIRAGGVYDTTRVRIGFRQIEARGSQLYLNGLPLEIYGVSRHQFLAGVGMSLTPAQNRKDIAEIKTLGANFVRLAHYSQSQDVYDACDELGLLVWTEIPAWQSTVASLSDPTVWKEDAEPQLRGMVLQHRNHPSVVVWSVANEIPSDKPEGAAFVARAVAYVKTLDTSRLITFATDRREKDISFAPVDFIAINEYFGWYYGKRSDVGPMLDSMHEKFPGKAIVVSEFGADAVAGFDPATAPAGSRDYSYAGQSAFLQTHMSQIFSTDRRSFVAGGLIWVYNDFPDPGRVGGDHPVSANYRNNKGLVTMERVHKPSFDLVQAFFAGLKSAPRAKVAPVEAVRYPVVPDLIYAQGVTGPLQADAYIPNGPGLHSGLLFLHGGDWVNGMHPGAAPFYVGHGTADATVPYAQAEAFVAALKADHVPVETFVAEGGPHTFWSRRFSTTTSAANEDRSDPPACQFYEDLRTRCGSEDCADLAGFGERLRIFLKQLSHR